MEKNDVHNTTVQDDVKAPVTLEEEIELSKSVAPDTGYTLLHIAILNEDKPLFDSLMVVIEGDVPLNCKDYKGRTALHLCCRDYWGPERAMADYFACALVKKGICTHDPCLPLTDGETFLELAVRKTYPQLLKLLIDRGHDLNVRDRNGVSPVWRCIKHLAASQQNCDTDSIEILTALLCSGADLSTPEAERYDAFEYVAKYAPNNFALHKMLFDFVVDDYTVTHVEIFFIMAQAKSPLFHRYVDHAKDVIVNMIDVHDAILYVFMMDADYLEVLMKKLPNAIRDAFAICPSLYYETLGFCHKTFFRNANILLEKELKDDTVDFLRRFVNATTLVKAEVKQEVALGYVCFLMSYGLQLTEDQMILLYRRYKYGELYKIIRHVEEDTSRRGTLGWQPFSAMLYDVKADLEGVLAKYEKKRRPKFSHLLPYFSNFKLRALCANDDRPDVVATIGNQPNVPLLIELARNVFRKHLVETFNVEKASHFYALVNALLVAPAHREIINLETELY